MHATQWNTHSDFDRQLTVGTPVQAHWTNTGHTYTARGEVVKLNAKSLIVQLGEGVMEDGNLVYVLGQHIKVPRVSDTSRWSAQNCATALDEGEIPDVQEAPEQQVEPEPQDVAAVALPPLKICTHAEVIRTSDRRLPYRCITCDTTLTRGALPDVFTVADADDVLPSTPDEPRLEDVEVLPTLVEAVPKEDTAGREESSYRATLVEDLKQQMAEETPYETSIGSMARPSVSVLPPTEQGPDTTQDTPPRRRAAQIAYLRELCTQDDDAIERALECARVQVHLPRVKKDTTTGGIPRLARREYSLDEALIATVRSRIAAGGISQTALAHELGLGKMTVNYIVRRVGPFAAR